VTHSVATLAVIISPNDTANGEKSKTVTGEKKKRDVLFTSKGS
jgi:hypothetical protein